MELTQPELARPPVPQVCQRCRKVFPGDPSLLPSAMIEWWACPACRSVLGLSAPKETPQPPSPACWYEVATHRPTMGNCPRVCNGAPAASEIFSGEGRRLYCEAHSYWRRTDAPRALVRRF